MNLPVTVKPKIYFRNVALLVVCVVVFLPLTWVIYGTSPGGLEEESVADGRLADVRARLQHALADQKYRENELASLRSQIRLLLQAGPAAHANRYSLLKIHHVKPVSLSEVEVKDISYSTNVRTERTSKTTAATIPFSVIKGHVIAVYDAKWSEGELAPRAPPPGVSTDLQPPGMHLYLPHILGHPDALNLALKMSRGRHAVSIVLGVPTVKRPTEGYLIQTVRSLVDNLSEDEKSDCLIVILIAEHLDSKYVQSVAKDVNATFHKELASGLLEVISPRAEYYPNMSDLKVTFGDTAERVKWRTKQNLDYAFLMLYAQNKGIYYVQLEDDVITKPGYHSVMRKFALGQKTDNWSLLEYSHLGFIGKLFRTRDLPIFAEFILMFYKDKPIDWLLDHFFNVRLCSPEKTVKHCQRTIAEVRRRYMPSLFQHVGRLSSLKGKVQKLKDRDFNRARRTSFVNPVADVITTLSCYQHFSIERAYAGEAFFWATLPHANDQILFQFRPPVKVKSFLFRSGHPEHPGDKFYNTTVDVRPVRLHLAEQRGVLDRRQDSGADGRDERDSPTDSRAGGRDGRDSPTDSRDGGRDGEEPGASGDYHTVASFSAVSGVAEGKVDPHYGALESIRLLVHSDSQTWVILHTIQIEVDKS